MDILRHTAHRQQPLPAGPWIMAQTWHNLLFAHWPIAIDGLRPLVPTNLEIDTYAGQAWVGIVAFRLSGIRLRGFPEVGWVSHFPEINVRTYVTLNGQPGVLFLSLDADNRAAIALAKPWFRLAYQAARIDHQPTADGGFAFAAQRIERGAPPSAFTATYRPTASAFTAAPGSLAQWLTERYCYYSAGPRGQMYRCDIYHPVWPLQPAAAEITQNTMALAHGLHLPDTAPLLHYAHQMQAAIWPLRRVSPPAPGMVERRVAARWLPQAEEIAAR
jgi:uncharacterized protein YqjF (DUF2071 family)